MKENSIGVDKKCQDKRKKIILNSSIAAIILSFSLTCIAGMNNNKEKRVYEYKGKDTITTIDDSNSELIIGDHSLDYSLFMLKECSKLKVTDLLAEYNYKSYVEKNGIRIYNYTSDDYKSIR